MARTRKGPLPVSDPHAEHPSPQSSRAPGDQDSPASEQSSLGEPGCAHAEPRPDDELRRRQRDEILRLQQNLEEEIKSFLHELARGRDRWC